MNLKEAMKDYKRYDFEVVVTKTYKIEVHEKTHEEAKKALMFAWMGPFIGALIRPLGGWIADKFGGAKVTQVCSFVMIASALGVAYFMKAAYSSASPEEYFIPFFLLFLVLFAVLRVVYLIYNYKYYFST